MLKYGKLTINLFIILMIIMYTAFSIPAKEKVITLPIIVEKEVERIKIEYVNMNVFINGQDINNLVISLEKNWPDEYEKVLRFYDKYTKSRKITNVIIEKAIKHDVSINTAFALAKRESEFTPNAERKNRNGTWDRGLFQLNSGSRKTWTRADFFDIEKNTEEALSCFKWLLDTVKDKNMSLAAYNAGYYAVQKKDIPWTTTIHVFTTAEFEYVYDIAFNTLLLPKLKHVEFKNGDINIL